VLKKCQFIHQIRIEFCAVIHRQILQIIATNCSSLEKLIFTQTIFEDISSQDLINFGQKIGNRLKTIQFYGIVWKENSKLLEIEAINQLIDCLLRLTPNLKAFNYYSNPYLFKWHNIMKLLSSDHYSLPKLVQINISYGIDYQFLKSFTDKYFKQIKTIQLSLNTKDLLGDHLNKSLQQISRFQSLEVLHLTIKHNKQNIVSAPIDSGLLIISQKCLKLKCFQFSIFDNHRLIKGNLFQIFGHFRELRVCRIKNLELNEKVHESHHESLECFKSIKNLSKLDLMLSYLSDHHFKDIHLYLPGLTSIKISSDNAFTDQSLYYLSEMPKLSHIQINAFNCVLSQITDSGVCHLIKNCSNITTLLLKCNSNITEKSIDSFIEIAKSRPKIQYQFSYVCANSGLKQRLTSDSNLLPNNLFIEDITLEFHSKYNTF